MESLMDTPHAELRQETGNLFARFAGECLRRPDAASSVRPRGT